MKVCEQMQIELESEEIGERRYYLVAPNGLMFHEISLEETGYLIREVWVSRCPCCGGIRGYYYSKNESKEDSKFCEGCIRRYLFPLKNYKWYSKQNVKFRLLTKGYRKYKDVIYPYLELK